MEQNKFETGKNPCICNEDSEESLNDDSKTPKVKTFGEAADILKKHLEKDGKCMCNDGQVKNPNRVSWVDEEDKPPECICQSLNLSPPVFDDISSTCAIPSEEPTKKKKSFGQTLKYIVTCAWCRQSEEPKPEPEPEPELDYEDVDTKDSGIISLLGRTYSEVSQCKDDGKKEPVVLECDVPEDMPRKAKNKKVTEDMPVRAKSKPVTEDMPVKVKTKEVPQEKPIKPKIKEVTEDKPVKVKIKDIPEDKLTIPKIKVVPPEQPKKLKTREIPQDIPTKPKIKVVTEEKPTIPKIKVVPPEQPTKLKTREIPQAMPVKPKTKEVTPKVSFTIPLPKKAVSLACICTGGVSPKYGSRSSSRVSTRSSKVKCKCTDPEETPSGQFIATKCVCGQPISSEASLASGYTIGSKASKPDCCYPEKSEEFIRKVEYQRPSQYSYGRYDQPLRTYGREAPSIRSTYTPSTTSYADSNLYVPEEDDISLNDTESRYSYRKSTSVIPSRSISETAAGPSQQPTLYQRLVKRFWLESILYREPDEPPSRVQSAPSYVSDVSLERPVVRYKTEPKVRKSTAKSKENECVCSKIQLVACASKESKQKANVELPKVEKPKAETTEQCICAKKSSESVSKTSSEVSISLQAEVCHCLEVLYMSKSPSKTDEEVLPKTPSDVSPGTSKVERKSKNVPTIIVTPAEETEAKLADEKGSKSSSNSSVVTVIDTHALQVPSVFGTKPVDVKKSKETQEQVASGSSTENPENPPLANASSGWWDKSKHLVIGSTVVGAAAIGAYQYFKE